MPVRRVGAQASLLLPVHGEVSDVQNVVLYEECTAPVRGAQMSDFDVGYLAGVWTVGAVVLATVFLRGLIRRRLQQRQLDEYFARVLKRD